MPRLQKLMNDGDIDVLIVSAPENVFYVSGVPTSFTSSNRLLFCSRRNSPLMCVVPREGEPTLVLSAAALDVTTRHTWMRDLRLYATGTYIWRESRMELEANTFLEALRNVVSEKLGQRALGRIGIELNDFSTVNYGAMKKAFPQQTFVDGNETLMWSRMIKNQEEIGRFKKANQILCKTMKEVEGALKDKPTEVELDILLKKVMLKEGAESWQQTTIAAGEVSGPDIYNQPVPKRKIKTGDLIRLDVGCVYKGYTADLSRTYAVEKVHPRALKTYKVLKEAFEEYIDLLEPGKTASTINIAVVDYVKEHLDKEYYRGNVGHGVGVELYDKPILGAEDDTPLQEGMTLSYEVPYHISGLGGLNIEDSVLITKNSKQVVSKYDRDIIVV
ncbi:MAG: M24 family metallopeptidase [Nitrososphaerales archaeon]